MTTTQRFTLPDWLGGGEIEATEEYSGCDGAAPRYHLSNGAILDLPRGADPLTPVAPPMPEEPADGAYDLGDGLIAVRANSRAAPDPTVCWCLSESVVGAIWFAWWRAVEIARERTGKDPVRLMTAAEHMAALLADAPELPHREMCRGIEGDYIEAKDYNQCLDIRLWYGGKACKTTILDRDAARRHALAVLRWAESTPDGAA